MTSKHSIDGLRVDVPTLEPDPVLLAQLVQVSSAHAPAATTSRATSVKVLLAAAGVAAVTATTWVAGAVPGAPSPIRPAHHPHPVVSPSPAPTNGAATPVPGPTSLAPGSLRPTPGGRAEGAAPTGQRSGSHRQQRHPVAHLGWVRPHHGPWPVDPATSGGGPGGLPHGFPGSGPSDGPSDGPGSGPGGHAHSGHATGPIGSRSWQHDHHGTRSGHGADPGGDHPGSTPTDGWRGPTATPTHDSRSPAGGEETSPP